MTMKPVPIFDLDMAAFGRDPYPALKQMRQACPIAYVPQLGGVVFAKRDDIFVCEKNIEVFSSDQPDGLMSQLMGQNVMRKDGEAHSCERKAMFPTVSPKTVRDHWQSGFETSVDRVIDKLIERGRGDVCKDIAMPISGEALRLVTGLTNATHSQMDSWSQAMIDGISNYSGDRDVEARCHVVTAEIDRAIDAMIADKRAEISHSLLEVMMAAGLPNTSVRANIKLAISGGQNEPRDVIAGIVWAMLSHRDQLELVLSGQVSWRQVFEEYCRWISPIGMTPRVVARDFEYNGVGLSKGDKVFFMYSSANRDEDYFNDGDKFDITRDVSKAISFGAGPHFCAGAWVARSLVAELALPKIFERFIGLKLADVPVEMAGWAFRGPLAVNVTWENG